MQLLKQSTAATCVVGPILDASGAVYTGAVIGDLNITKNGTTAAMAAAATLTHDHNGHYILVFTTGNTDTLGRVDISCNKATYAMPQKEFEVLAATTFDAIVTNAAGSANGMLYNGSNTGAVIPTVTTVTNQLTAAQIATGVWQDSTAGDFTTASSIGKALYIANVAPGGSGGLLISGTNSGTTTFGALTVSGATTLAALSCTTLTASGAVAFQSTFATTGTTTFNAFTVTNATTLSGAVSLGSTLGVTGTTTLAALTTTGTMTVNAFTCTNNFTVSGNWLTTGTTTWTGAAAFSNGLTSNITGTLSTVTTLTNLPAITAGWLTATGIAADAITAAKVAADVTTEIQSGLATAASLSTVAGYIDTEIADIQSRLPAALVSGRMDASVGAMAANVITAAATAADFSTEVNAGILAVLGALNDVAADGAVTTTDTMVAYLKQIINTLEGAPGLPTWPASAAPANGVSIAEALRYVYDQIGVAGVALTEAGGDGDHLTAINLPNQTMDIVGNITGNLSGSVGSVTGNVGGNVVGSVASVTTVSAGAISEASFATTAGSFVPLNIIDQGTAQSATSTTIVLRSAAAFADNELVGARVAVTGGSAGVGQSRLITAYVSATDTATVSAWTTTPTGTITYKIFGDTAAAGGSAPTAAEVADAIWDEARSGHVTSGSFGEYVLADCLRISGDATAADNAELFFDGTGYNAANSTVGTVTLVTTTSTLTTLPTIPANWLTAAGTAADFTTEIQTGLATAASLSTVAGYIDTEIADIQSRLPAALVSGRMDASVGAMAANVLTATAIAADAITDSKVASDVTIASVTGSVGSVTGNVGGNVVGTVASVVGAVGSVTGNVGGSVASVTTVSSGAISEASFATTAGSFAPLGIVDQGTAQSATSATLVLRSAAAFADDELIGARVMITGGSAGVGQSRLITDYVSATDTATVSAWTTTPSGTISYKIFGDTAAAGGSAPTAAEVADAVWDEARSGHVGVGSFGEYIDPWATEVPGAYAEDTAGYILGNSTGVNDLLTSEDVTAAVWDVFVVDHDLIGSFGSVVGEGLPSMEASIDNIQSRLPAALVSGRMDASVGAYQSGSTPTRILASGTADSGSTTTIVDTERTEADANYWKGAMVVFTDGSLVGQHAIVTGFDQTTDTLTFSPAVTQAVSTHAYELRTAKTDVEAWTGTKVTASIPSTTAFPSINLVRINGNAANDTNGFLQVDVERWATELVPGTSVTGVPQINVKYINGSAIAGTGTRVADGFTSFFNVAGPTLTIAGINQTGDSFARLGAPNGVSVSADIAVVGADVASTLTASNSTLTLTNTVATRIGNPSVSLTVDIAAVQADTDDLQTRLPTALVGGKMDVSIGAIASGVDLSAVMKASVNAEIVSCLALDLYAEPGQGTPATMTSLADKISFLYKSWLNKSTQTADQWSLYGEDGTTIDQKAAVSDDETKLTRTEVISGP